MWYNGCENRKEGCEQGDDMDFAHNLKTMRTIRKLTQAELAEAAMTAQAFISHMETGKMLPSPDLEARLRKALDWGDLEDEAFAILSKEPAGGTEGA